MLFSCIQACYRRMLQLDVVRCHVLQRHCLHLLRPSLSLHIRCLSSSQNIKDKQEKPLSYLQSGAVHYRMKEAEQKRWRRKEWAYNYILLPCSTATFFLIVYLIYFSKELEPTEEQLEHLKSILDRIEAKKRVEVSTGSDKPSSTWHCCVAGNMVWNQTL